MGSGVRRTVPYALPVVAAALLMACDSGWDVHQEIDALRCSLTPTGGRIVESGPVEGRRFSVQTVWTIETPQGWEEFRTWVDEQLPAGYELAEKEGGLEFRKVMEGDVVRLILEPRQSDMGTRIEIRFSSAPH